MSFSQVGQFDESLMKRLQEMVPDLRKEIERDVRKKMDLKYKNLIEQKKQEIQNNYQQQLQSQVMQINAHIKNNLSHYVKQIEQLKKNMHHRQKSLTPQEEDQFIQQTVDQILNEFMMLEEVKNRLKPKIQIRVKQVYQKQMEAYLETAKRDMIEQIQIQKQKWTEDRAEHWKRQTDLELQTLAEEHNQLNSKKKMMEESFKMKRNQKKQLQNKYQMICDKNQILFGLKRQFEGLKRNIKC